MELAGFGNGRLDCWKYIVNKQMSTWRGDFEPEFMRLLDMFYVL